MASATDALVQAGVPDPSTDAALLLAHVLGVGRMALLLVGDQALSPQQEQRFSSLLHSRAARVPLQYLLGSQCFYGLDILVDPRALIPRPETETLCQHALEALASYASPRVLDVCTGSGAIALTIAHFYPAAQVTATDISGEALSLAQENAKKNQAQVRFLQGNLLEPVAGERFDCILSNPPYIEREALDGLQPEVRQEPRLALDGGEDGLDFYRVLAREAHGLLAEGGALGLEIGSRQGKAVQALLAETGAYQQINLFPDLAGLPRVVWARKGTVSDSR